MLLNSFSLLWKVRSTCIILSILIGVALTYLAIYHLDKNKVTSGWHGVSVDKNEASVDLKATKKENLKEDSTKYILIFAYMHTGSTYMGNLIRRHPKVFYNFEPVRDLTRRFLSNETVTFLNHTSVKLTEKLYHVIGGHQISDVFTCDLDKLDVSTLTVRYKANGETKDDLGDFVKCTYARAKLDELVKQRHIGAQSEFLNLEFAAKHVKPCIPKLIEKCQSSEVRAIKVIRMSMEMLEYVLGNIPNIRVIHLLRDPRAMLDSNVRKYELGLHIPGAFEKRAKTMCEKMLHDLKTAEEFKAKYPGKIYTLRYEDFTSQPANIVAQVHNFVDLPFTNVIKRFVLNSSVSSTKNSTYRSEKWRTHISQQHLEMVENNCKGLFEQLGYIQLWQIQSVRNISVSDHLSYDQWLDKMQ